MQTCCPNVKLMINAVTDLFPSQPTSKLRDVKPDAKRWQAGSSSFFSLLPKLNLEGHNSSGTSLCLCSLSPWCWTCPPLGLPGVTLATLVAAPRDKLLFND
ncbi:hypothetical protein ATANTOWER_011274 [Ataeniobius toweri]|uniref:Uncharacterized protein n=1 Tax=Ataeniobius toweri TaxID=208326 RepID=A0ABU7BF44_9TELE|nr:hypothetical protein [Ataeniobius toweri]